MHSSYLSPLCPVTTDLLKYVFYLLWWSLINPFTAMLAMSSLWKLPMKVPNLKSLRPFFPFTWARERISIKMHSTESRFVIGTIKYTCYGVEWSKDKTQAAESIKWRPQQAYGSNQFLLVQPQTVFSTHTKSSRSRIDKRTARATGNTRYRYSKIAPLDHKMADNCVSLARRNTLSSTITKPIKTSKTSNKSYSYNLLNCINKMYTHDLFYLQQEWEEWLAPVYIQIRTTKSQLTQCTKYNCH